LIIRWTFRPGDLAGILGGLTLGIIEVGRHGNHGVGDCFTQIFFGGLFHLAENHRRDLSGGIGLAGHLDHGIAPRTFNDGKRTDADGLLYFSVLELPADQPFDREQRPGWIGHGLTLGDLTDKAFATVGKRDNRRCCPITLTIFDNLRITAFHDRHAGIGGSQVNANYFSHISFSCLLY
jgi:hypothetical protein